MLGLSVCQPWAYLVVTNQKVIECRNWIVLNPGFVFMVQASQKVDMVAYNVLKHHFALPPVEELVTGAFVGKTRLKEVKRYNSPEDFWKDRMLHCCLSEEAFLPTKYGYVLDGTTELKKPIPFKGSQRFFNVPGEALRVCRDCGCSTFNACPGGCFWVEHDLCSACAPL